MITGSGDRRDNEAVYVRFLTLLQRNEPARIKSSRTLEPLARCSLMEHKAVTYTVVQTLNPFGWRWTVELPAPSRNRTGETFTRDAAVRRAMAVIDKLDLPLIPKT